MKTILISLVALALLGKAQDETIGSVTTPAKLVANQIKARKAAENPQNTAKLSATIGPSANFTAPKSIWSKEDMTKFSFVKGDMAFDEKLISIRELNMHKNCLVTLSKAEKTNYIYIRVYEQDNQLGQYNMRHIFREEASCALNDNAPVNIHTSNYNYSSTINSEIWLQYTCANTAQRNYLIDNGKLYPFFSRESVKTLPKHLQAHALNMLNTNML